MGDYLTPADVEVTASWQAHKDRDPPSSEPGTDYATAYDTPLRIADAGWVAGIDHSNDGGEGRRLTVDLDDGHCVSYIHLAAISAYLGQRVHRGQTGVAWTGASGHGSDHGYDPHVHVSLWERPGMAYRDTIDFEQHTGEDEDMTPEQDNRLRNIENMLAVPGGGYGYPGAILNELRDPGAPILAGVGDVQGRLAVPGAGYDYLPAIMNQNNEVLGEVKDDESADSLAAPAWTVAGLLILITIVEVARLVLTIAPG
jgi:murein DD-endopeptidase MepM/ murein hydrolase activator NlpD